MHALYELKKQLMEELEGFAKKGEINASSLAMIDTLAHATKNLCKVIEASEEEEYSNRMSRRSYANGMSGRSYEGGMSGYMGEEGSERRDGRGRFAVERGRAWADGPSEDAIRKLEELKGTGDDYTRRVVGQVLRELRG